MKTRLSGALASTALALLVVAATNGNKGEAAAPPEVAQVVENLRQAGAATKLDGHGNVVAVDFGRARPNGFDFSQACRLARVAQPEVLPPTNRGC